MKSRKLCHVPQARADGLKGRVFVNHGSLATSRTTRPLTKAPEQAAPIQSSVHIANNHPPRLRVGLTQWSSTSRRWMLTPKKGGPELGQMEAVVTRALCPGHCRYGHRLDCRGCRSGRGLEGVHSRGLQAYSADYQLLWTPWT